MNERDLRVIKTRNNIQDAFISLLKEKGFQKITVQDILDRALINRSTFYYHYQDKYQLAEKMCQEVFEIVKQGVAERFQCTTSQKIWTCLEALYENLLNEREKILLLFKIHTETIHLYEDMSGTLKSLFYAYYIKAHPEEKVFTDYFATLYAAMAMSTIQWCLENGDGYKALENKMNLFMKIKALF